MYDNKKRAFVARASDYDVCFLPQMANRHGLITGATGTGKTVSLQVLAETFSDMGVPVFAADIKGDLSGIAKKGGEARTVKKLVEAHRLTSKGYKPTVYPVAFWDVFGERGHHVRASVDSVGSMLLERMLMLNNTQGSILNAVFQIAKDEKRQMKSLKDLKTMVQYVGENRERYSATYANIAIASIGTIQRSIGRIESENGDMFFTEPELELSDIMRTENGKGVVNLLVADELINAPRTYTTFLLWLLTKMYKELPEVGDDDKPKMVVFLDEAHLIFRDMPKMMLERVEQIVRLIRSKGVGVYFVSQSPADIPDLILGQLGNRIQHALRAYTPNEYRAVKIAARYFRPNPTFNTEDVIAELGIGEALVSFLDNNGAPLPVERVSMLPPQGSIGALTEDERAEIVNQSPLKEKYAKVMPVAAPPPRQESAYRAIIRKNRQSAKERRLKRLEEYKKILWKQLEQM